MSKNKHSVLTLSGNRIRLLTRSLSKTIISDQTDRETSSFVVWSSKTWKVVSSLGRSMCQYTSVYVPSSSGTLHCFLFPICLEDGQTQKAHDCTYKLRSVVQVSSLNKRHGLYFSSFLVVRCHLFKHRDPSESRVDYLCFVRHLEGFC